MTNREAYCFGYAFACVTKNMPNYATPTRLQTAAMKPMIGFTLAQNAACSSGAEYNVQRIAEALAEVDSETDPNEVISLSAQASWQLGFFAGRADKPIKKVLDIKKARLDLGMTQAEFADAIGVSQKVVSNWESGKSSPRPKNEQRIIELLNNQ